MGKTSKKESKEKEKAKGGRRGAAVAPVADEIPPWFTKLMASVVPPGVPVAQSREKPRKRARSVAVPSDDGESDASSAEQATSAANKSSRKTKGRSSSAHFGKTVTDDSDASSVASPAPTSSKGSRKHAAQGRSDACVTAKKPPKKRVKASSSKTPCELSDELSSDDAAVAAAGERANKSGSCSEDSESEKGSDDEEEDVKEPPISASATPPCLTTRRDVQKYLREEGFPPALFRAPKRRGAAFGPVDGTPPDVVVPVRSVLGERVEAGDLHLLDPDDDLDAAYDKLDGHINLSRLSFERRLTYVRLLAALARLTMEGKERLRLCMLLNSRGLHDVTYLALRVFPLDLISAEKTSSDSLMTGVWWYLVVLFMQRQLTMSVGCTRNAPWAVVRITNENWCKVYRWVELLLVLPVETSAIVHQLLHQAESISAQFLGSKVATQFATDSELVKKWWAFRYRAAQLGKIGSMRTHEMDMVPGFRTYWLAKHSSSGAVAKTIASLEQQDGVDVATGNVMQTAITASPARYTECLFSTALLLTTRLGTTKDQRADRQRLAALCRELRVTLPASSTFELEYSGQDSALDKAIKQLTQFSLRDSQAALVVVGEADELRVTAHLTAPTNESEVLRISLPICNQQALQNELLKGKDATDQNVHSPKESTAGGGDAESMVALPRGLPAHLRATLDDRQFSSPSRLKLLAASSSSAPSMSTEQIEGAVASAQPLLPGASTRANVSLAHSPPVMVDVAVGPDLQQDQVGDAAATNHAPPQTLSHSRLQSTGALLDVYTSRVYDLDAMRANLQQNPRTSTADAPTQLQPANQLMYLLELVEAHVLQYPTDKVLVIEPGFWDGPYTRPSLFRQENLQKYGVSDQRVVLGLGTIKTQPFLVALFAARDFAASYPLLQYAPTIVLLVETRMAAADFELLVKCILLRLATTLQFEYGDTLADFVQPVVMRIDVASPTDQYDTSYLFERFAVHASQLLLFSLFPTAVYFRLDLLDEAPSCDAVLQLIHRLYEARHSAEGVDRERELLRGWGGNCQEQCTAACARQGFVDLFEGHTAQMFAMFVRAWSLLSSGNTTWVEYLSPGNVSAEFGAATEHALTAYNLKLRANDAFATAEAKRRLQRCGFQCMRQMREIAIFENPDGLHVIVTEDGHKMLRFRKPWTVTELLQFTRATLSYSAWGVGSSVWCIQRVLN